MNRTNLNIAFIGIGSNEGNRLENIKSSLVVISELPGFSILKVSSIYETLPFGNVHQNNFLNAVVKITTYDDLHTLLKNLKKIEKELGRVEREKWGPREIDLDILLFNDLIFSDEIITLPHKGIIYRDFVLVPLCEIEPDFVHPVFNKKVCELVSQIKIKNILNKISEPFIMGVENLERK